MGLGRYLGLFGCLLGYAQQTLINLPSADITPRKKIFVLHETQARPWSPHPYWATSNFLVYGLSSSVELAATLYEVGTPKPEFSALAVGYKWSQRLFEHELPNWTLRAVIGQMMTFSLRGHGRGLWTYAMGSVQVPDWRTRITAGFTLGPRALFGGEEPPGFLGINTAAFVASVEQPITEWLDVVVEWYSGEEHEFAYLIPGAVFHVEEWSFVLGYKLANSPEEKDTESVVIEVGRIL